VACHTPHRRNPENATVHARIRDALSIQRESNNKKRKEKETKKRGKEGNKEGFFFFFFFALTFVECGTIEEAVRTEE